MLNQYRPTIVRIFKDSLEKKKTTQIFVRVIIFL